MYLTPTIERSKTWPAILCLAFSAFIFNTTEFIPVGLLPNIAESFEMTAAGIGLIITIYAWAVSILSLPLTILTAKFERKKLLIFLFLIFIVSHIITCVSWNFVSLMIGRLGIACAHAVFWAIATPLAVRLAPNGKKAKAMGFIVAGSAMAIVLGVPLGTMIGQVVGWRITFLCIAVIALFVLLILIYLLPSLPSTNSILLKNLPSLLKRPALINVYILTAIVITGHFTAYTYITEFMNKVGGFYGSTVVFFLLCIGFSGIIGSIIFTKYSEAFPITCFVSTLVFLFLCLMVFYAVSFNIYSVVAMCLFWGIVITMFGMLMQSKVLEAAPDGADIATSVYSGVYNIGIGGGALIGSIVIKHSSITLIGYTGAGFVFVALMIFIFASRRIWIDTEKKTQ